MPQSRRSVVAQSLKSWDLGLFGTIGFFFTSMLNSKPKYLDVPGARLLYKTIGSGPVLLLIPGANGNHGIFQPIAYMLSKKFTVVTYDRRGFSSSKLTAAQDYSMPARLERDADDAALLMAHLTGGKPGYVMGNSSGAIVTMMLVQRHPDIIAKALFHEPPSLGFDPHGDAFSKALAEVRALYYDNKLDAAINHFTDTLGESLETGIMYYSMRSPKNAANVKYWFDHEARAYPTHRFDEAFLREHHDKIEALLGEDTEAAFSRGDKAPLFLPLSNIAKVLEKEPVVVPGGHVGFALKPRAFSKVLQRTLPA